MLDIRGRLLLWRRALERLRALRRDPVAPEPPQAVPVEMSAAKAGFIAAVSGSHLGAIAAGYVMQAARAVHLSSAKSGYIVGVSGDHLGSLKAGYIVGVSGAHLGSLKAGYIVEAE